MSLKSLALAAAFAATTLAHGTVTNFAVDGTNEQGYLLEYYYEKQSGQTPPTIAAWSAMDLDNGFISPDNYTGTDIVCHKSAEPGGKSVNVKAGGTVKFQWTSWPSSHIGPVLTYVAKCPGSCTSANKATLKWVKIDAEGYDVSTKTWASTKLINQNSTWTTKVPSTLAPGNYVFRHEIIALHAAEEQDGAQNYPQCFNIAITGSGTENPEGTLGTKLYTPTDPGILFNPYTTITSYKIPGPALYGSGSSDSSGSSASGVATPVATPVAATPVSNSTSLPAPSIVAPNSIITSVIAPAAATSASSSGSTGSSGSSLGSSGSNSGSSGSDNSGSSGSGSSSSGNSGSGSSSGSSGSSGSSSGSSNSGSSSGSGSALPKTFTLDTFIAWLKKSAGGNTKRHARDFN